MRVFITGIDGFAGRHLTARLKAAGNDVQGSTLEPAGPVDGSPTVACDVRDADRVHAVIADARPDGVVHLAAQSSGAGALERPRETFDINAGGALNVLEACRRTNVGRVLLVTSSEVYGDVEPAGGPLTEDARLAPVSPYGASKAAQDVLGGQYWRTWDVPVVRARAFQHTGPGQAARFLFPSVARRVALAEAGRGPCEVRVGDASLVRDVVDVRDVVAAYAGLLERGTPGEAYNVCTGRGRTLADALEPLLAAARRPVRLIPFDPGRARPGNARWLVGDPTRLRQATGWSPEIRWEDTMRDVLEEWRGRIAETGDTAPDRQAE